MITEYGIYFLLSNVWVDSAPSLTEGVGWLESTLSVELRSRPLGKPTPHTRLLGTHTVLATALGCAREQEPRYLLAF